MRRDIYSKVKTIGQLADRFKKIRKEGKKIVHCHGVFDLLHPGHLKHFESAKKTVDASSNINIPLFGGDFAIFGPIEQSDLVFPMIAWQDILISEYTASYFGTSPVDSHPGRKFF